MIKQIGRKHSQIRYPLKLNIPINKMQKYIIQKDCPYNTVKKNDGIL